jgi:hypothetical protein
VVGVVLGVVIPGRKDRFPFKLRLIIKEKINYLISAGFVQVVFLGRLPLNVSFEMREKPVQLLPVDRSFGVLGV